MQLLTLAGTATKSEEAGHAPAFLSAREAEYRAYATSYGCSLEEAKLDVDSEYNEVPTQVDAFYERMEAVS